MAASDELLTERLLRVIDEGRRVATYKLALLMALIDVVGATPDAATIQTRLYLAGDGVEHELRQITATGSPVLRAALRLRLIGDGAGCRRASEVRRVDPAEFERAVTAVEDTFVRYPIPLLQVVGASSVPFLYDADWPENTPVARLRAEGRDHIRLLEGVADRLVVLGPLIRPLIELHWTRDVAQWSRIGREDESLHEHLFGSPRLSLPRSLRDDLVELQNGRCFYCEAPMARRVEIDHFLARSRWPNDAIENFVVADACNGHKSDHLASADHVARWAERIRTVGSDLRAIASRHRWISEPERTIGLVTNTYGHLAPETPLWVEGAVFERASGPITVSV